LLGALSGATGWNQLWGLCAGLGVVAVGLAVRAALECGWAMGAVGRGLGRSDLGK